MNNNIKISSSYYFFYVSVDTLIVRCSVAVTYVRVKRKEKKRIRDGNKLPK